MMTKADEMFAADLALLRNRLREIIQNDSTECALKAVSLLSQLMTDDKFYRAVSKHDHA